MDHLINIGIGLLTEIKRIGIKIHFDKPQLDFEILPGNNQKEGIDLKIKNAGNRPAYNVYAFLFEQFMATEIENNYIIKSLGDQNVRSGVLTVGEEIVFNNKKLEFNGCDVTCIQEIWIDYSDEDGDHYRTIVLPISARGDDLQILPPFQIKKRLPMIPGHEYSGDLYWEKIRSGESSY